MNLKAQAAAEALKYVEDGMRLGIGTGSTAEEFCKLLAVRVSEGLTVIGVPTSERTAILCRELGVPLSTLEETPSLDLTIDGADEVDPAFNLIKGGGGALLREKIVASASSDMIVIADDSKLVDVLGAYPLPIEVNKFGLRTTLVAIEKTVGALGLSGNLSVRCNDAKEFVTDGGHLIVDASFGRIPDPQALSIELLKIPGVVEHGLFTNLASKVILAGDTGIRTLTAPS